MVDKNKIKSVCEFYAIAHRLKNTVRAGWQVWGIEAKRLESIAEHCFGTQCLAFAINSQFELGLDITKVVFMLAFHDLAEAIVGDIPVVSAVAKSISPAKKHEMELNAITKILSPMNDGERINQLWLEYEEKKTRESIFARLVDKLECNFQIKFYEEKGCNDIHKPRHGTFKELCDSGIRKGYTTLAKMWIEHDKKNFEYDDLFTAIADYIIVNRIFN
jgi:putative hydrolase of HD superfamily